MSSLMPSYLPQKKLASISLTVAIAIMALSTTGCNTTQELKPTASVIVGAHKSL